MDYALMFLVILGLLVYHVWKDVNHRRQIEQLQLLVKAKDVPEFITSTMVQPTTTEAEPSDVVYPEEMLDDPEALLDAVSKR